jgi:hypothetical protein
MVAVRYLTLRVVHWPDSWLCSVGVVKGSLAGCITEFGDSPECCRRFGGMMYHRDWWFARLSLTWYRPVIQKSLRMIWIDTLVEPDRKFLQEETPNCWLLHPDMPCIPIAQAGLLFPNYARTLWRTMGFVPWCRRDSLISRLVRFLRASIDGSAASESKHIWMGFSRLMADTVIPDDCSM